MMNPLDHRLAASAGLSAADGEAARLLFAANARSFPARRDMFREGERPKAMLAVIEGWGFRYKMLPDGRRQIVGFLIPGDVSDPDIFMLGRLDHSVGAINELKAAAIGESELRRLLESHPALARWFRCQALQAASIQREWILSVGQRTAYERIAHLMCELFLRMRATGLAEGSSCDFPITQTDMGDATGLTSVHVNRTIKTLRDDGLIRLRGRRLTIPNLAALMEAGLFTNAYLHVDQADLASAVYG
jgi:CRP-like cAMP-binding protein